MFFRIINRIDERRRNTSAALESYFPKRKDAATFLKLINLWWTMSNSKTRLNMNFHLGDAAKLNDGKPLFFRKLAKWITEWKMLQSSTTEKYTLTKQTSSALTATLMCTASLIEDLLQNGYSYFLTARLQTDPLELRFSKYRRMSGGRFLVGLREVITSERILTFQSLLKETILFWEEDIRPDIAIKTTLMQCTKCLEVVSPDLENCYLNDDSAEVASVVAGYVAKKMIKRTQCFECKSLLVSTSENECNFQNFAYLLKLSRGGLIFPATDLSHYVCKSFAMLDVAQRVIRNTELPERLAAEHVLESNNLPLSFMCEKYAKSIKLVNRIICNVFFNNTQKAECGQIRKDVIHQFKRRNKKRRLNESN